MTLTEVIVTEFIEHYLKDNNENDGSTRKRKRNGQDENSRHVKCSKQERQQCRKILPSLIRIAKEFDKFIGGSSKREERFAELAKPLVPLLTGNCQKSRQQYSDSFRDIADELFSQDITWSRIVTFLVYSGELACKVTRQSTSDEKISRVVTEIIDGVCTYFDEKIMQWINQQDGGWLNIIIYEDEIQLNSDKLSPANSGNSTNDANNDGRARMRQVISVAAMAVIIGGLYMCSKLSVQ